MADFNRPVYALLGLPLDAVSSDQALEHLEHAKVRQEKCFLSTPNLNFLVASTQDESFRATVCRSDLSVADGMPLVWLAKLLGIPIHERVAGSSLFESLCYSKESPWRVFFFGGGQGAAMHACLEVCQKSGMTPVGLLYPGFGSVADMSDDELIEIINTSGADFLVVSLGAAKGQAWISANLHRLKPLVVSHLGAVVNFAAGSVKRSPVWMQKSGLEWLWRIKEEPQLWRRYFKDGVALGRLVLGRVLPLMCLQALARPEQEAVSKTRYSCDSSSEVLRVTITGPCIADNLLPLRQILSGVQETPRDVKLDVTNCHWIDSASCGLLMLLDTWLLDHSLSLRLSGVSAALGRLLRLHGLPTRVWL